MAPRNPIYPPPTPTRPHPWTPPSLDPHHPLEHHPTTAWQSFVYSFGHYSVGRTTWSYRIPFDKQLRVCDMRKLYPEMHVHVCVKVEVVTCLESVAAKNKKKPQSQKIEMYRQFFSHSLTATKRRMVVKSGAIFTNPCLLYQDIRTGKKPSKERYTSKVRREKLQYRKRNGGKFTYLE